MVRWGWNIATLVGYVWCVVGYFCTIGKDLDIKALESGNTRRCWGCPGELRGRDIRQSAAPAAAATPIKGLFCATEDTLLGDFVLRHRKQADICQASVFLYQHRDTWL